MEKQIRALPSPPVSTRRQTRGVRGRQMGPGEAQGRLLGVPPAGEALGAGSRLGRSPQEWQALTLCRICPGPQHVPW